MSTRDINKKIIRSSLRKNERNKLIFYWLMMAIPLLQLFCFYFYVNFNSILMAFERFNENTNGLGYITEFVGFENFVTAFEKVTNLGEMVKNSLIFYGCQLLIVTTLALLFSYYIAKKYPLSGFFRVVLYLPSIVSSTVVSALFQCVGTEVYQKIVFEFTGEKVLGLFDNPDTVFGIVLFFNLWLAYGQNVMIYTGTMSSVNESIIESAHLDGTNFIQEFWYIYMPQIYPTFVTFIVTGMAGVFTHQMHMYNFFGQSGAMFDVFGYFFYRTTQSSDIYPSIHKLSYPELSAIGVVITAVLVPITLLTRKLLTKFGPSVD